MSSTAVVDRAGETAELDWVILREPASASFSRPRVQVADRGADRRGLVGRSHVRRPPRTLVALPSVDDLTS